MGAAGLLLQWGGLGMGELAHSPKLISDFVDTAFGIDFIGLSPPGVDLHALHEAIGAVGKCQRSLAGDRDRRDTPPCCCAESPPGCHSDR